MSLRAFWVGPTWSMELPSKRRCLGSEDLPSHADSVHAVKLGVVKTIGINQVRSLVIVWEEKSSLRFEMLPVLFEMFECCLQLFRLPFGSSVTTRWHGKEFWSQLFHKNVRLGRLGIRFAWGGFGAGICMNGLRKRRVLIWFSCRISFYKNWHVFKLCCCVCRPLHQHLPHVELAGCRLMDSQKL